MLKHALIAVALFTAAAADEKDAKPGTAGPPPGKGWRRNEAAPAPGPKAGPAPKATKPAPPAAKPAPEPASEGIGPKVAAWAKSGIYGRQLAAMIHQLQATRAKQPVTPPAPAAKPKKGQPEAPPPAAPKKPKKSKGQDKE
ncbi:unnamed protein product [Gemmataceae bacterium]|nr:unnamed protein product [Gemmataceae bacterium]VTU02242.1 unnamed protein product [Gemmataceae bacterium]